MSVILSGFPTAIDTPNALGYMSRCRGTYRRMGIASNHESSLAQNRQCFAVYRTPSVIPIRFTRGSVGWAADAVSFTASLTETGLVGTDVINGSVASAGYTATITEIGLIGTSAIQALETYLATVTGAGIIGTSAIQALETFLASVAETGVIGSGAIVALEQFRAAIAEAGTAGSETISAIEAYLAQLASESATGADTINGSIGAVVYSASIAEVGETGTDAISANNEFVYMAALDEQGEAGSDAISADVPEIPVTYSLRMERPILFSPVPQQRQRITARLTEEGEQGASAISCTLYYDASITEAVDYTGDERINGGRRNNKSRTAILYYLREVA